MTSFQSQSAITRKELTQETCDINNINIPPLPLINRISTAAAGSGIPDVKGWLNGSSIPGLFQMKTFVVKLVGVIFSVSAKFIIGKEGPMVHAGSALASGMALGRNKTMEFDTKTGYSFRNDVDGRDLISCGVAAGVAAAFGAPIGGMLFALEEVASFWLPGLTWRAFFAASKYPTITSTINPTHIPSISPSNIPTYNPTYLPSINPTLSQFNRHQYHQQYYQQYHQQYFQQ